MKYELKVDVPGLDEGASVELSMLGVFKNGTTTELDEHRLGAFLVSAGKTFEHVADLNWPAGITLIEKSSGKATAVETLSDEAEEPAEKKAPTKKEGSK